MLDNSHMTKDQAIVIREIADLSEMHAVEEIQKEVWHCDDREIFPALALIPMRHVGAILQGAFAEDKLVGFVFGFPGLEHGEVIIHSDLLAVKPEYRAQRLGYQLKLAQREAALARGIERITWTFDPLQSVNAHLNFAKLGVTANQYKINFYGETTSPLHSTGTDRLWVDWHLRSRRVMEKLHDATVPNQVAPPILLEMAPNQEPRRMDAAFDSKALIIEIPADYNRLAQEDLARAQRWRQATREVFTQTFAHGFQAVAFLKANRCGVGSYLCTRRA
jgi:chorismate synthase